MNASTSKSFLVFSGGNDRAVIAFLRALNLCGHRAHIVARTKKDRVLKTDFKKDVRWVRQTHDLTIETFKECIQRVRDYAKDEIFILLPSTEYFNTFLLQHRDEVEELGCEVPLVDRSLYSKLTEKKSSTSLFSEMGISIPAEIPEEHVAPPIVAKPIRNSSASGQSIYPHLIDSQEKLENFINNHKAEEYFFQEYLTGESHYLMFYIPRTSGLNIVWSQQNILQQPGGKSVVFATPSNFHLSETASRIVSALNKVNFHGLGMVEVMKTYDRDVFIEMNPRIWGPSQFCVDQDQGLLQAFIGDTLFGDPNKYLNCTTKNRRNFYLWSGGVLKTILSGQLLTRHKGLTPQPRLTIGKIICDLYLRKDSWRCFIWDATNT